jgi:hypothetical protein
MTKRVHMVLPGDRVHLPGGVEYRSPEAARLAEITLTINDLEGCAKAFKYILNKKPYVSENDDENFLSESLFRDSTTQLAECLSDKYELSPQRFIAEIEDGVQIIEHIKSLRDTYSAHRFGPQRQCAIRVFEIEGTGELAFSPHCFKYSLPGQDVILAYIDVVERLMHIALQHRNELAAQVREQIIALGSDAIEKLPEFRIKAPENSEMRLSRKKFRARND